MQSVTRVELWTRPVPVHARASNRLQCAQSATMPSRRTPDAPFTAAAAMRSGWTRGAQRHAVRTKQWDRLQLGVFAPALAPDPRRNRRAREANLRRALGAAAACERAALSHASAAIAADLPVLGRAVDQPCVTVESGTALRRLAKVHLHRATLGDVGMVGGVPVTPIARTVVDLAREHGFAEGVVTADAALREGLTTPAALTSVLELQRQWPGIKTARRVVGFADGRSESPLESVSRIRIDAHRLSAPQLQALICDEHGRIVTRSDFYWDEFGVVGEADGAMKWEDDPGARDERDATTYQLEALGLVVVRWGWSDLRSFAEVARRLRLGFERGARTGTPQRRWGIARPR